MKKVLALTVFAAIIATFAVSVVYSVMSYKNLPTVYSSVTRNPSEFVVENIDQCKTILRASVYKFSDQHIEEALVRAMHRGVKVYIIADAEENKGPKKTMTKLQALGAHVYLWNASKLHAKFVIYDDKVVTLGSNNWSKNSGTGNMEIMMRVSDCDTVTQFINIFDTLLKKL